jgi:hypothetical protein
VDTMKTNDNGRPAVYTADKPLLAPSSEELRASIPGWGVDLDPADRPSVPRERFDLGVTSAHWDFPERQPGGENRERSIEHGELPPVFGTAQPLHGLSGAVRRLAYRRYSEGRTAHWLLLVLGDRIEVAGAMARSLVSRRPDNPITQTGVLLHLPPDRQPLGFSGTRVDKSHRWMDPLIVAGPWLVAGWVLARLLRR